LGAERPGTLGLDRGDAPLCAARTATAVGGGRSRGAHAGRPRALLSDDDALALATAAAALRDALIKVVRIWQVTGV